MWKYSMSAVFNDEQELQVKSLHFVGIEINSDELLVAEDIARDMMSKAIENDIGHLNFTVLDFKISHT